MNQSEIHDKLITLVGRENVLAKKQELYNYSIDYSTKEQYYPLFVVKPANTEQVSMIVKFCNEINLNLTVRGGGSSVSGGALSNSKDVIISLERLNKIIEIDEINRHVIAEAGVITQILQDELKSIGYWFPQNISSSNICFIGGNVAISSGSPKSLKYGSTKNYVLNLQVVLADGQIIWTGKNVRKNATGYNLTQLFVGSEGTLGIITKVVLEITPLKEEILVLIPFKEEELLFQFVFDLFHHKFDPSSLEFLDRNGYKMVCNYFEEEINFLEEISALLWIEFESERQEENLNKLERLDNLIQDYSTSNFFVAQTNREMEKLWRYRKNIGNAAINHSYFKDLDLVVPKSKIEIMYMYIKSVCQSLNQEFIVVGHIGDGNFHVNIFKDRELVKNQWEEKLKECITTLVGKAIELGGDISGEHGIGKHNKTLFSDFVDKENLKIFQKMKKLFDPKNLFNSGTIFIDK
ncbi:MAG: FAD-linked oxidase C-terminal domain-containing protein [Bacteroidota bacterium]